MRKPLRNIFFTSSHIFCMTGSESFSHDSVSPFCIQSKRDWSPFHHNAKNAPEVFFWGGVFVFIECFCRIAPAAAFNACAELADRLVFRLLLHPLLSFPGYRTSAAHGLSVPQLWRCQEDANSLPQHGILSLSTSLFQGGWYIIRCSPTCRLSKLSCVIVLCSSLSQR